MECFSKTLCPNSEYSIKFVRKGGTFSPLVVLSFNILGKLRYDFISKTDCELNSMPLMDKLMYYRYRLGYTRKEVAEATSINICMINSYETTDRTVYHFDDLLALSKLYGVELDDICDDYNYFLQTNQAEYVRNFRKKHELSQRKLGLLLGISKASVQRYENKGYRVKKEHFDIMKNSERHTG